MNVTANQLRMSGGGAPSFENTKSLLFDGVDEYIDFSATATYTNMTISFWMKRNVLTGHKSLFKGTGIFNDNFQIPSNTNYIKYNNWNGWTAFTGDVCDGAWHHIVFVNDISGTEVRSYVDGVLDTTLWHPFIDTTGVLWEFASGNNTTHYMPGSFDELSIWDSILSIGDITTLFNSGTPNDLNTVLSSTPVNWWRFGDNASWDGSDWTLTDQGSGSIDGTTVNMEEADRKEDTP